MVPGREASKKTEFEITGYDILCRGEFSFKGLGGLNVMDVRREWIPLLWSMVGETALAKGFCFNLQVNCQRQPFCVHSPQPQLHRIITTFSQRSNPEHECQAVCSHAEWLGGTHGIATFCEVDIKVIGHVWNTNQSHFKHAQSFWVHYWPTINWLQTKFKRTNTHHHGPYVWWASKLKGG